MSVVAKSLPELIGSEKQWANKIRAEKLDILNKIQNMNLSEQQYFFSHVDFYKLLTVDEKIELRDSDNKIATALKFAVVKNGIEKMKNNQSAEFWINNRYLKLSALILMNI